MTDERPFSGLRVFDATQGIAGPHATMLLGLHGADIVKVEPLEGDWGRFVGRSYEDFSAHYLAFNRGKRSIALDLKSEAGRGIAQNLAAEADIVVEAFRPGVMAGFGLGYDDVSTHRPDVVYCSISGFGHEGPNRERRVSDSIIQAFSGMMIMNKDSRGMPQRIGMIAIDVMTGLYAFQSISAAMLTRFRFGRGAFIDCNMMQSAAAFQSAKILEHYLEGDEPTALFVPLGPMPTADGFINISGVKHAHYVAICETIGRPDLIEDTRFADRTTRLGNADELLEIVHGEFVKKTTADWQELLSEAGIMNAPIADYGDFLADGHVQATDSVSYARHAGVGDIPIVNIPGTPRVEPDGFAAGAPHLGEHSREILSQAGYGSSEIDELISSAAVGDYGSTKDAWV